MPMYEKKPVRVEAIQITGYAIENSQEWADFIGEDYAKIVISLNGDFRVDTLEGCMKGSKGDWLVRGTHGELYPVKADIFFTLYSTVE